jgi:hypothetical protein
MIVSNTTFVFGTGKIRLSDCAKTMMRLLIVVMAIILTLEERRLHSLMLQCYLVKFHGSLITA